MANNANEFNNANSYNGTDFDIDMDTFDGPKDALGNFTGNGNCSFDDTDGNFFTGICKNFVPHGKGRYETDRGIYTGVFKGFSVTGRFKITRTQYNYNYKGMCVHGEPHGKGTSIYKNGRIEHGVFNEGTLNYVRSSKKAPRKSTRKSTRKTRSIKH